MNPIHQIQAIRIIIVRYKWWSYWESLVNVISGDPIELIPKFIKMTNQIEISSNQSMIRFKLGN